jgi:hypothetical protein
MASLPSEEPDTYIPEILDITLEEFEIVYPVWILWRATDMKFLPSQLIREPQELTDNILYLDNIFEKMVNQKKKK